MDRFCAAMIAIREEIGRIGSGESDRSDNALRNAPHTAAMLATDWDHGYDRREAAFPVGVAAGTKYWPPVRRIEGAFGDRNLVCNCEPLEAYVQASTVRA